MKIKISSLILALGIAVSMAGCGEKEAKQADPAATKINVTVDEVTVGNIEEKVSYTGELKASNGSGVSAKVSGTVKPWGE